MRSVSAATRWTIALVVWVCVIWGHSLMPGDVSSGESSLLMTVVRPLFELFGCSDPNVMTFVIRKTAHFSENAILAFIAVRMAVARWGVSRHAAAVAGAIWLLVPVIDETIQLFVPKRAGMATDVLIDLSGGLLGMLVGFMVVRAREKRRLAREQ